MAGTQRHRERSFLAPITGKYWWYLLGDRYDTCTVGKWQECDDVVGNSKGDNPFYLINNERYTPVLNGRQVINGKLVREFTDYPIGYHDLNPENPIYPGWEDQNLVAWANLLASKTNPSRASTNMLQVIGELRDIPGLWSSWKDLAEQAFSFARFKPLRNWTSVPKLWRRKYYLRNLPSYIRMYGLWLMRATANANLSWKFAFAPMYNDLCGMLTFANSVDKRFQLLKKLDEGKYLNRGFTLHTDQHTEVQPNKTVHSQGALITADRTIKRYLKIWGTIRYTRTWDVVWPETKANAREFYLTSGPKLVKGQNVWGALEAWWELIPWSWLSDWFADVGGFIDTHNNSMPMSADGICIMQNISQTTTYSNISKPAWVDISGSFSEYEVHKIRTPVGKEVLYLPPLPFLPILSSGQWSILGSLAIQQGIGVGSKPKPKHWQAYRKPNGDWDFRNSDAVFRHFDLD